MDIKLLVKVTSKAWSLAILARMHQGVPGRQAALIAATGAQRSSFAASLGNLLDLGLLERNPGHGHPLRPEFRLTPGGVAAAAVAARVMAAVPGGCGAEGSGTALLRRSWSVPILAQAPVPRRFGEIRAGLGTITDRALSQGLHRLEEADWIRRAVDVSARRPFPLYQAMGPGLEIARASGVRV